MKECEGYDGVISIEISTSWQKKVMFRLAMLVCFELIIMEGEMLIFWLELYREKG